MAGASEALAVNLVYFVTMFHRSEDTALVSLLSLETEGLLVLTAEPLVLSCQVMGPASCRHRNEQEYLSRLQVDTESFCCTLNITNPIHLSHALAAKRLWALANPLLFLIQVTLYLNH